MPEIGGSGGLEKQHPDISSKKTDNFSIHSIEWLGYFLNKVQKMDYISSNYDSYITRLQFILFKIITIIYMKNCFLS